MLVLAGSLLSCAALSFHRLPAPATGVPKPAIARSAVAMNDPWATASSGGFDSNTIIAVLAALAGVGGGVGLIAFTENRGARNDEQGNAQPCVVCKGKQVVPCRVCEGSGEDPLASLVAGVKAATGDTQAGNVVTVEDWDSGPKQVVMYEEILNQYPVKATSDICTICDGRGVAVCDNCDGSGIQPRFLERYSPDDFMD